MNGKDNPTKFWEQEFGKRTIAHDFAGREVHKEDYGKQDSPTGWDIDEINPSQGEVDANQQITNIATNRAKADKITFKMGDTFYQVQKANKARKRHRKIADYCNLYEGKRYAIVKIVYANRKDKKGKGAVGQCKHQDGGKLRGYVGKW